MSDDEKTATWLSHELHPGTQAYGGGEGLSWEALTSIAAGDTANTRRVTFPNHLGTHVDLPSHFFDGAPTMSDYDASDWVFHRPVLIDVDVASETLVRPSHCDGADLAAADLVLIRTGHEATRGTPAFW